MSKEVDEAEKSNYPEGRPGSLLNRMISHGNKKTEDEIKAAMQAKQNAQPAHSGAVGTAQHTVQDTTQNTGANIQR